MKPLAEYAKVPFRVEFAHPLLSAIAAGAIPRATAATAAIAKFFAIVLRFMIISSLDCEILLLFGKRNPDLFYFPLVQAAVDAQNRPGFLYIFGCHRENGLTIDEHTAEITNLLRAWGNGDKAALVRLTEHVYPELRLMAGRYMKGESQGNTLQATALVHEVYLRLVDVTNAEWQARAQFFAIAAQMMRRILVDAARGHGSRRRDGIPLKVNLDESAVLSFASDRALLALDEALTAFSAIAPRQAKVVELRYFGGLTEEEIVAALKISPRTARRDWHLAKAWLLRALSPTIGKPSGR